MGLLDDAIREHLDLKRRHGADPAEVERAEREALGPVRRGAEPQDQVALGDEDALIAEDEALIDEQESLPYDDEEAEDWEDLEPGDDQPLESEDQPLDLDHEPERAEPPPAAAAPSEVDPGEEAGPVPTEGHGEAVPDEPGSIPTPHPAPALDDEAVPHPEPRSDPGEETAEYEVEDALAEEQGSEREDVLEETPEFLQDTPDHDRLWFEQRPPRDFDFEG